MIDSRDAAIINRLRAQIELYLTDSRLSAQVEHYCRALAAMTGAADAADARRAKGEEEAKPNWAGWWWVRSGSPDAVDGWKPVYVTDDEGYLTFEQECRGGQVSIDGYYWGGRVTR